MKLFLWMMVATLSLFCVACFIEVTWLRHNLTHHWPHDLPAFSALVTGWLFWLLLVPFPWFGWAVFLTRREELSVTTSLRFAGTACLAVAVIFFFVLIASLLPFTFMSTPIK